MSYLDFVSAFYEETQNVNLNMLFEKPIKTKEISIPNGCKGEKLTTWTDSEFDFILGHNRSFEFPYNSEKNMNFEIWMDYGICDGYPSQAQIDKIKEKIDKQLKKVHQDGLEHAMKNKIQNFDFRFRYFVVVAYESWNAPSVEYRKSLTDNNISLIELQFNYNEDELYKLKNL